MAAKIKKGDRVVVLAGRDKGKSGEVMRVIPKENRAVVSGINTVQRHQKQTASQEGGIISKSAPINLSQRRTGRSEGRQADPRQLRRS